MFAPMFDLDIEYIIMLLVGWVYVVVPLATLVGVWMTYRRLTRLEDLVRSEVPYHGSRE